MEDKYATFLAALAGLADSPVPSTRDEALLKSIVDRLSEIATAASTAELPAVASTDKDKFLHTAAADGALEWVPGTVELPPIPGEAGEYSLLLTVSEESTVLSWEAESAG